MSHVSFGISFRAGHQPRSIFRALSKTSQTSRGFVFEVSPMMEISTRFSQT